MTNDETLLKCVRHFRIAFTLLVITSSSAFGSTKGDRSTQLSGYKAVRVHYGPLNKMIMSVRISGQPANLLVDTGSNEVILDAAAAESKDDIKTMDKASQAIFALRPVTFRYKKEFDPDGLQQFGLMAEEVQKVNPDLVALDKEGKPYAVRYEQVNAMLLNEFLKEHRKVTKLESTIAQQQKQIQALTAGLQKVSDQLELSKPAPRAVLNDQ